MATNRQTVTNRLQVFFFLFLPRTLWYASPIPRFLFGLDNFSLGLARGWRGRPPQRQRIVYRSWGAAGRVPRQNLTECSIMQRCRGSCAPRFVLCSWLLSSVMSAVSTSVVLRCAGEGGVRVPGSGARRLLLKGIPVLACCRGKVRRQLERSVQG